MTNDRSSPAAGATLGPFMRWAFGVFLALALIAWGIACLASARFVVPAFLLRGRDVDAVVEGAPASLYAVAMISFGVFIHLQAFWVRNPYRHASVPSRVFAFIGAASLILGLSLYILQFVAG